MDDWTGGAEAMRGAVMHLLVGALLDASLQPEAREQLRKMGEAVTRLPVSRPPGESPALQ